MIYGLNPYPAMKDSGVPWLGEVPEHWEVKPLGALLRERGEINARGMITAVLSVLRGRGVIPYGEKGNIGNKKSDDITRYKIVRPGDIVVNSMNVIIGSVGISSYTGCLSPVYYVLTPQLQTDNPRYLNAYFQTQPFQRSLVRIGKGILAHRMRIPMELLKREAFPRPPSDEQALIARFLDHADRLIRRYVGTKRRLIKLLEEQKQAVIHHAVTRGLDPNVRLKDSGIGWLGDIPEHWKLVKLRHCGSIVGGMTPSMSESSFWGGDTLWVTPKDMKRDVIEDTKLKVTAAAVAKTALKTVPAGSVLMVVRGMILARRVPVATNSGPVTINQDMKAIIPAPGISSKFLARLLSSAQSAFVPLIDEAGHGTKRFPTERWRDLAFAFPPEEEQIRIVACLRGATVQLDRAINEANSQISLFHEYRARLIADTVTGKIDVREAAEALPETKDEPGAVELTDDTDVEDALDDESEVEQAEIEDAAL